MAKHCEHCNQEYPDELKSCPHCAAAAEAAEGEALLVDDDALQTQAEVILFDENAEGPAAAPALAGTEEVVDLADVQVLHQEPAEKSDVALAHEAPRPGEGSDVALGQHQPPLAEAISDVALAHVAPRPGEGSDVGIGREAPPLAEAVSDVALAAEELPPGAAVTASTEEVLDLADTLPPAEPASSDAIPIGEEEPILAAADSAISLGEPVEVVADASGVHAPASGTSDVGWAELVAAEEEPPAPGEVVVDAASDADLIHDASEPLPVGEEEEVVAEDWETFSTLRPEQLPKPLGSEKAPAGAGAEVPAMELGEPEVVTEVEEEGEPVEVVAEDEGNTALLGEGEGEEVIDLGEEGTGGAPSAVDLIGTEHRGPGGDLDLVSGAMEPGASNAYLGEQESLGGPGVDDAIDLTESGEAGEGALSAVDLTGGVPEGSASSVDLTAGQAVPEPGSGSGLNLNALGAAAPEAEGEALEEWPTQQLDAEEGEAIEETIGLDGPPSARDIVEQVESGVDLAHEAEAVEDVEETVSIEPGAEEGEDSAIDLGGTGEHEAAPAPAGGDSDLLMEAMEEEAAGAPAAETEEGLVGAEEETPAAPGEEGVFAEEEPVGEEEAAEPAGAGAAPARARGSVVPWVGGWLIGTVLTAAGFAGLSFLGVLGGGTKPSTTTPPPPTAEAPTLESAHTHLSGGDFQGALKIYGPLEATNADNPVLLAQRGEALWLSALEQVARDNKPLTKDELSKVPDVEKARADLQKASTTNADALFWLGQIQQFMDGPNAAKQTFEKGLNQFPGQRQMFQAALDSMEVNAPEAAGRAGASLRRPVTAPEAYWRALALVALQGGQPGTGAGAQPAGEPAGAASAEDEAGSHFWNAVHLAQQNKYEEAIKALNEARSIHDRRRYSRLRKAQNPLSDPYEQIFLRACDELIVFWQAREKLGEAGLLAKDQRPTAGAVRKAMDDLTAEHKDLVEQLKAENYDTKNVAVAVKQLVEDKNKAETDRKAVMKKVTDVLSALKTAGVKGDDPIQGVMELDRAKKADEKKLDDVLGIVRAAGIKAEDALKGVEDLDARRKAEEAKLAKVATSVKEAGIKAEDPVKGVEDLVADRREANDTLDDVRKQLVTHKYLPGTSIRPDVPKGVKQVLHDVDHPVVVALTGLADELSGLGGKVGTEVTQALSMQTRLTTAQLEAARLDAVLSERWTPEQMMDVWLVLLRDPAHKDLAARALKDVQRVLNEKEMPAAVCVRGLAERDGGKFDEARADLKSIVNAPGEPDAAWRKVVRTTLDELTDPRALYVPRLRQLASEGHWSEALNVADEAVRVFAPQEFGKDRAALLALRSLVELELSRRGAEEGAADKLLRASRQDAEAALAGGETLDGSFAQGRLAEAQGDLAAAEKHYRAAVKAFEAANGDEFGRAHPVGDPAGNRYREALTRVLLEEVRRTRPTPAEAQPAGQPGTRTGRAAPAGKTTVAVSGSATAAQSAGFVVWGGSPQTCVLPLVALQQGGAGAGDEAAPVPDPRLQEALELSDKLIAAGDARGFLLRGEILGRMSRWNDGLKAVDVGVKRLLPPAESLHISFLLENHPAFQRREGLKPPDPVLAEEYYAAGLHEYFDRRYVQAERNFSDAVYYNDQDARYLYFLGLSRLPQAGKRDLAVEDFRQGGRLEQLIKPSSAAVSTALERVQGPARHLLNRVREEAIREVTSKQP
jgi:tetratricopeptide (TPR) repeat protein